MTPVNVKGHELVDIWLVGFFLGWHFYALCWLPCCRHHFSVNCVVPRQSRQHAHFFPTSEIENTSTLTLAIGNAAHLSRVGDEMLILAKDSLSKDCQIDCVSQCLAHERN